MGVAGKQSWLLHLRTVLQQDEKRHAAACALARALPARLLRSKADCDRPLEWWGPLLALLTAVHTSRRACCQAQPVPYALLTRLALSPERAERSLPVPPLMDMLTACGNAGAASLAKLLRRAIDATESKASAAVALKLWTDLLADLCKTLSASGAGASASGAGSGGGTETEAALRAGVPVVVFFALQMAAATAASDEKLLLGGTWTGVPEATKTACMDALAVEGVMVRAFVRPSVAVPCLLTTCMC